MHCLINGSQHSVVNCYWPSDSDMHFYHYNQWYITISKQWQSFTRWALNHNHIVDIRMWQYLVSMPHWPQKSVFRPYYTTENDHHTRTTTLWPLHSNLSKSVHHSVDINKIHPRRSNTQTDTNRHTHTQTDTHRFVHIYIIYIYLYLYIIYSVKKFKHQSTIKRR